MINNEADGLDLMEAESWICSNEGSPVGSVLASQEPYSSDSLMFSNDLISILSFVTISSHVLHAMTLSMPSNSIAEWTDFCEIETI